MPNMTVNNTNGYKSLEEVMSKNTGVVPPYLQSDPYREIVVIDKNEKPSISHHDYPYSKLGSAIGFAGALVYAFHVKSGFWKGFGYTLLGSMALGGIGTGIDYMVKNSNEGK